MAPGVQPHPLLTTPTPILYTRSFSLYVSHLSQELGELFLFKGLGRVTDPVTEPVTDTFFRGSALSQPFGPAYRPSGRPDAHALLELLRRPEDLAPSAYA